MFLLPRGLTWRLILALTFLVALVEVVFTYLNVRSQERQLLAEMITGADQLSRSITSATWQTMMADQPEATYRIIETIGEKQGIESIRIFNKEGRVTYSTDPHAPRQVDKRAEACFLCHAREEPLVRIDVPSRARIYGGPHGRRLAMVTPIYNEPSCSNAACHAHPVERTVLGVLDIALDLDRVDHELAGIQGRAALMTVIQIVLIGLLIALFIRHWVGNPIRRLIAGTKAVSDMDLDQRIDVRSGCELGELGEAFDHMRLRLRTALEELNELNRSLEEKVEQRSRQLSHTQQKLIQSDRMASLGQLAASVAHEINNPVSGVLNFSMLMQRILKEDGIPPERVAEFQRYLQTVSDETARVGRIVSDLLSFSRRSAPQRALADVNRIVEHTIPLIAHKLQLGSVALELSLGPGIPELLCDRAQIQQVVINLVMNAGEAVQSGGQVMLRTRLASDGGAVILEVEDSGSGIPEEYRSKIFDPFFSTKEEGKGVGLGLAVVYGIIDAHGGSITVESAVGRGTIFTVQLPLGPDVGEAVLCEGATDPEAGSPPGGAVSSGNEPSEGRRPDDLGGGALGGKA
ncbi:MAG: HAMP domain-containing protein [Candidatus Eisenbacteria sp.]|nr:HAMP domain-containing protein [Candidatus Eisenbacteria bacterium]